MKFSYDIFFGSCNVVMKFSYDILRSCNMYLVFKIDLILLIMDMN